MSVQINNSTQPISYKEFDVTIPAGGQYPIQQPFNYVRLLSSNTDVANLNFRFGALSTYTKLTLGIGFGAPEIFPSLTVQNVGNSPATIRVAFAVGVISDDRLNVSGTVTTTVAPYDTVSASLETFPAGGSVTVNSSGYKRVVIQNNSSTNSIYIFNNNTFEVKPFGTFDMDLAASFTVYGTNGETISVGLFE